MSSQEFVIHKEKEKLAKTKHVSEEVGLDVDETLAKNYWASFRTPYALELLLKIKSKREKINRAYNQKTMNTMLLIAGVYRDINKLEDSAHYYEQIQKLDEQNLPANDPRLTRDEGNLAMTDYLRGDSETNETKRKQYFENGLEHIIRAQSMWHAETEPDMAVLTNLFFLKYLTCRELGDDKTSKQAYGEMKYLEKKLNRTVIPPRT